MLKDWPRAERAVENMLDLGGMVRNEPGGVVALRNISTSGVINECNDGLLCLNCEATFFQRIASLGVNRGMPPISNSSSGEAMESSALQATSTIVKDNDAVFVFVAALVVIMYDPAIQITPTTLNQT